MTAAAPTAFEWRVGRLRLLLPATIHSIALVSTAELAQQWSAAGILVAGVALSAAADAIRWHRERGHCRKVVMIPGGVQIENVAYQLRRAWLGPGWTALWLKRSKGGRRLFYVVSGEVTPRDHAALRRHAKHLDLDV